jgi:hypothetical protein
MTFGEFEIQPADYELVRVVKDLFCFVLVGSDDGEEIH